MYLHLYMQMMHADRNGFTVEPATGGYVDAATVVLREGGELAAVV